jgi:hypothetical protein
MLRGVSANLLPNKALIRPMRYLFAKVLVV